MMSDLGDLLRRGELPVRERARELAVIEARSTARRSTTAASDSRRPSFWIAAAAAACLVVLAISPPGQSAISWAAELVGIGDVGGPPTNEDRPEMVRPASDQVVIANGTAPEGTRYEIVAYRTDDPVAGESDVGATCIAVDFPSLKGPSGVACGDDMFDAGRSLYVMGASGPGPSGIPANPYTTGYVTPKIAEVTVSTGSPPSAGQAAKLVFVDDALKRQLDADESIGYFLAFLPRDFDVEGLGAGTEGLEVTAYDAEGNLVDRQVIPDAAMRRHAEQAREASAPGLRDYCRAALEAGGGANPVCEEIPGGAGKE
jgi:hypothetical protein